VSNLAQHPSTFTEFPIPRAPGAHRFSLAPSCMRLASHARVGGGDHHQTAHFRLRKGRHGTPVRCSRSCRPCRSCAIPCAPPR
jgi:hypothetical protein